MFDTTKEDLKDLLRQAHEGKVQLPDFQRSYVWNDEDVRSLLASVAKGYPIGALLMLEGGSSVNFKPRLLEGAPSQSTTPTNLLLDGQQRVTSLYQTMFSQEPVRTRNDKKLEIERYYYIDIKEAVANNSADIDKAIVGVPADRIIRRAFGRGADLDLSLPAGEFEHDLFPLNRVFDTKKWFRGWRDYWKPKDRDVDELERKFDDAIVDRIQYYKVPIIRLDKDNSREAICLVFEKVNVGGKKLDAFELVTAIYASEEFDLREDWGGKSTGRLSRIIGTKNRRDVLAKLASTDFLQGCSLIHTRERREQQRELNSQGELPQISCTREALLALPLTSYKQHSKALEEGFIEAGAFLNEQKIIWNHDIPYPPVIVSLASVFAILGPAGINAAAKKKLERWFWSVTFGELYGSATESRLARDVPDLVEWIRGGNQPRSLDEALFQKDRLNTLRSRQSAAYKGVHARLMRDGSRDFITGKPADIMTFANDKIDIHHIFPKKWCKGQGIPVKRLNSIINKTPLSKRSNIVIGGHAPSVYLKRIEDKQGLSSSDLDDILRTHLIEPKFLRADDFEGFYKDRRDKLADIVERAMEKKVVVGIVEDGVDADTEADDEDDLEEGAEAEMEAV